MAEPRAGTAAASRQDTSDYTRISSPAAHHPLIPRCLDRLALAVIGAALGLLLQTYVLGVVVVDGESMAPSLHRGDHVLIEKITPRLGAIERGDVVVLYARDSSELLLKRVVGTAGEAVSASAGRVYVNGEPLRERDYAKMKRGYGFPECLVGPSELFVLGDNRHRSEDSATWGCISVHQVIGRCLTGPLTLHAKDRSAGRRHAHGGSNPDASGRQSIHLASGLGPSVRAQ